MTKPHNTTVDLPKEMLAELGTLKAALPEDTFIGRVPDKGPRRTWGGVIRWMMDTHPEVNRILGKDGEDGSTADAGTN